MNEELGVWALIQNNEFEKACEKADKEFEKTGNIIDLRNKIYALFHLKKYIDVITLIEWLIVEENGQVDADFLNLGTANWALSNTSAAIEAWLRGQNSIYKDAAGGIENQVFLYFAGIKTGEGKLVSDAKKSIKKLLKSKRSTNWPGPMGHYLLDEMTEHELHSCVWNVPILKERQLCQLAFVSAIKKLEVGANMHYLGSLRDCNSYGPFSYLEQMYYLAKCELELMI